MAPVNATAAPTTRRSRQSFGGDAARHRCRQCERSKVTSTAANTAVVITPQTLAPSAYGRTISSGLTAATSFCATFAVVGTQLTAAIPMVGLYLRPEAK